MEAQQTGVYRHKVFKNEPLKKGFIKTPFNYKWFNVFVVNVPYFPIL